MRKQQKKPSGMVMKKNLFVLIVSVAAIGFGIAACNRENPEPESGPIDLQDTVEEEHFIFRWECFEEKPFSFGPNPDWIRWRWTQYGEDSVLHFTYLLSWDGELGTPYITAAMLDYTPDSLYRYRIEGDSVLVLLRTRENPTVPEERIKIHEYTDSTIVFEKRTCVPTQLKFDAFHCRIIHGNPE